MVSDAIEGFGLSQSFYLPMNRPRFVSILQNFLKRLSNKEFDAVEHILRKILVRDTSSLDIKKLSSYKDVYRVRIGSIRIIFLDTGNHTEVLEISRRSEKTYKDF